MATYTFPETKVTSFVSCDFCLLPENTFNKKTDLVSHTFAWTPSKDSISFCPLGVSVSDSTSVSSRLRTDSHCPRNASHLPSDLGNAGRGLFSRSSPTRCTAFQDTALEALLSSNPRQLSSGCHDYPTSQWLEYSCFSVAQISQGRLHF